MTIDTLCLCETLVTVCAHQTVWCQTSKYFSPYLWTSNLISDTMETQYCGEYWDL